MLKDVENSNLKKLIFLFAIIISSMVISRLTYLSLLPAGEVLDARPIIFNPIPPFILFQ